MTATIADRLAIEDLFVRYTTALDAGDVETIVGCFAEDGTLDSPTVGSYAGRAAIRDFARRFARLRESGTQLRHMVSNFQIAVDGDRAHATCYLINTITRDGASRLLAPGRYECDLVRIDRQWLFQRRLVILDHAVTLDGV